MPVGPGKYDDVATRVRELTGAEAVALIVVGGVKGTGFSCHIIARAGEGAVLARAMANVFRDAAQDLERDAAAIDGWSKAQRKEET